MTIRDVVSPEFFGKQVIPVVQVIPLVLVVLKVIIEDHIQLVYKTVVKNLIINKCFTPTFIIVSI